MILTKGHGTENDFVIVADPYGERLIGPDQVAALCDRRAGIGGDGLLRVVRTAHMPGYENQAADAEWFMDYRNADGSIAEMCGNGVRVFALYLASRGFEEPGAFNVATRAGVKPVVLTVPAAGGPAPSGAHPMAGTVLGPAADRLAVAQVTVDMGIPAFPTARGEITVDVLDKPLPAVDVDMGNPHAVVFVDSVDDAGDLYTHPIVSPHGVYAEGVNVEFVADVAPRHVAMRVHERGVGETRSCGTGACAAMIATARRDQAPPGTPYTVDVPGGRLEFVEREDGHLLMTGPAVLVFDVTAE